MASVWNKIDPGLALIYMNFLAVREHGAAAVSPLPVVAEGGKLHVLLRYQGDLGAVERAGFETIVNDGQGRASGTLRLDDLEAIAARDEVLTILYGSEPQLALDVSVPQIRANQLWSQGPGPLFEFDNHAGRGVIIGIIDTGVDIHHPFLWRRTIPDKATRILRIWDMGLVKTGAETPPDRALLDAGTAPVPYGVEYTKDQINKVLNKVPTALPIRHRDCKGHGTHVTSIAAGDGRPNFNFRGVAPRADLVIVKLLDLATAPPVGPLQRFKDAVTYIRRVADKIESSESIEQKKRSVVINYSVGSMMGPHDGLDVEADWLSNEFRDEVSAGKIFVVSAGNAAGSYKPEANKPDVAKRQHARIVFSAAGTVEIPFEPVDTRTVRTEAATESDGSCGSKENTKPLILEFYYPSSGAAVNFAFKPQGKATFTDGPALVGGPPVPVLFSGRVATLHHAEVRDDLVGGTTIRRNQIRVIVPAHPVYGHLLGDYVVKLEALSAVTVHVWCFQYSRHQFFRIGEPVHPLPPEVVVEDRFLIGSPASARNVITVASYNAEVATLDVAETSSRGPVARHGPHGLPPDKPDIAAPGVAIDAAKSRDTPTPLLIWIRLPLPIIEMGGTSMAAPHVAGVIALMLQKNPSLTPSQVRSLLQKHALKVPAPVAEEVGGGRLDAKATVEKALTP